MKHCNQTIKISMTDIGIIGTTICSKPIYKDGLCSYHYRRKVEKSINWIDRPLYREITVDEMMRGCSMKFKNTNQHNLYRYRKGIIEVYSSKNNSWSPSIYPVDNTLFCKKS